MGEQRAKEAIEVEVHSEQLCVNLNYLQKELNQLGGEIDELSVRKDVYRSRELNDKIGYYQGCLRSNNSSQGDNYYTGLIREYEAEQRSIPLYPEARFLDVPDSGREVLKCGSLLRKKRELRKQMLEDKRALSKLDYLFRHFLKPKKPSDSEDTKDEIKKVLEGWNGSSGLKQHYVEVFGDKSCDKAEENSEEEEKNEDEKKEDEKAKPAAGAGKRHRKRQNDASKLLRKSKSDVKPVQQEIRPAPAVAVELVQPEQPRCRNRQNPFGKINKKPKTPPPAEAEEESRAAEKTVPYIKYGAKKVYAAQDQMKTLPYIKSIAKRGYAVLIMLLAITFGLILLQSTSIRSGQI